MAKDAEAHAAEDRRKKEEIDARNQADSLVYSVEKMLKEHRSKISEADAKEVEAALEETRSAMKEGGVDRINQARDRLQSASHKVAEAMYRATSQAGGGAGTGQPGGSGASGAGTSGDGAKKDNVVDAEFVDVDEDKKQG